MDSNNGDDLRKTPASNERSQPAQPQESSEQEPLAKRQRQGQAPQDTEEGPRSGLEQFFAKMEAYSGEVSAYVMQPEAVEQDSDDGDDEEDDDNDEEEASSEASGEDGEGNKETKKEANKKKNDEEEHEGQTSKAEKGTKQEPDDPSAPKKSPKILENPEDRAGRKAKNHDDGGSHSSGDDSNEKLQETFDPKHVNAAITTPVPNLLLRHPLREYQHVGLHWLAKLHDKNVNGILADEMGLGKTIQTIALLAHLAVDQQIWGPHLIVVPTSLQLNWEMEIKKWAPGFKVLTYFGNREARQKKRKGWTSHNEPFHIVIVSYNLILSDIRAFLRKRWYLMILDEAHHIKNFRSLRWQSLIRIRTERRLLLTGTPLQNHLMELWSLLHFLMPDIFESALDFKSWFADPLNNAIQDGRVSQESRLVDRLHAVIRPFMLRRLKCEVERQMPAKVEHVVLCKLSRRQQVLYEEFMSRSETQKTIKKGDYFGMMALLMQLRKVCNHPELFEPRTAKSPLSIPAIRLFLPGCILLDMYRAIGGRRLYDEGYCSLLLGPLLNVHRRALGAFRPILRPMLEQTTMTMPTRMAAPTSSSSSKGGFLLDRSGSGGGKVKSSSNNNNNNNSNNNSSSSSSSHNGSSSSSSSLSNGKRSLTLPKELKSTTATTTNGSHKNGKLPNNNNNNTINGKAGSNGSVQHLNHPSTLSSTTATTTTTATASTTTTTTASTPATSAATPSSSSSAAPAPSKPAQAAATATANTANAANTAAKTATEASATASDHSETIQKRWASTAAGISDIAPTEACLQRLCKRQRTGLDLYHSLGPPSIRGYHLSARAISYFQDIRHQLAESARQKSAERARALWLVDRLQAESCGSEADCGVDGLSLLTMSCSDGDVAGTPLGRSRLLKSSRERRIFTVFGAQQARYRTDNDDEEREADVLCETGFGTSSSSTSKPSGSHTKPSCFESTRQSNPKSDLISLEEIKLWRRRRARREWWEAPGTALTELCQALHKEIFDDPEHKLYQWAVLVPKVQVRHHVWGTLVLDPSEPRPPRLWEASRLKSPGPALETTTSVKQLRRLETELRTKELLFHRLYRAPAALSMVETLSEGILRHTKCQFPDKEKLIRDSGKLWKLGEMLKEFRRQGSKCIIFTQFSKMLDVLEAFINFHRFTYVRLDGSVRVDRRQGLVDCFNADPRIFLFIASTRAGGVGINLTGANVVIFYDSDWNPAMDRQATDRAHRIGQTREVHIYRLIAAHTVEENIWRRQLQKRELDHVVVDQGNFTIDTLQSQSKKSTAWSASDVYSMLTGESGASAGVLDVTTALAVDFQKALGSLEDEEDARLAREAQVELEEKSKTFKKDFPGFQAHTQAMKRSTLEAPQRVHDPTHSST